MKNRKNRKNKMISWLLCASLLVGGTAPVNYVKAAGTDDVAQESGISAAAQDAEENAAVQETCAEDMAQLRENMEETAGEENVDANVACYVNCNDTALLEGENYGIYNNGAVDQTYVPGADGEYSWGYDSSYNYENTSTSDYSGYSVRMIAGNDAAALTYYFELPAGKYNLEVGVPHCVQWGNRVMNVDYQIGDVKTNLVTDLNTTNDIADGSIKVLNSGFEVVEEKQVVTVTAVRSHDTAWAPFLGFIKISMDNELLKAVNDASELYTAGNSNGIYTEESWNAFVSAYEAAVLLQDSSNEEERAAAAAALREAKENLTSVNPDVMDVWTYDFEDGIGDGTLVVNKNGISSYSAQAVYGEGRTGGKALKTGSYGIRLNHKNLGDAYTVNVWAKPDIQVTNNTSVVFLGYNNPEKWLSIAGTDSDACKIWMKANGTYTTLEQTLGAAKGEWVMYTVQSDGTDTIIYENGEEVVRSTAVPNVLNGTNQDIYLGVNFWDGQFRGLLDDISVYSGCLSADEIYQLYEPRSEEQILQEDGFSAPLSKTVTEGASKQLYVNLPKGVKNATIAYHSENEAVVTVDGDGKLTGVNAGEALVVISVTAGTVSRTQTTEVTVRSAEGIVDETVSYYVDCGNEDTSLAGDDRFGQYNRVPDQKVQADPVTGKTWGWGKLGDNEPQAEYRASADADSREYTSRAAGSGSNFYYEFELPENIYQVEITIPHFQSGSNTRTFEVLAGRGDDTSTYETIANNINTAKIEGTAKTYTARCTADGMSALRISFLSDSDAWGPIVSAIKIVPASTEEYVERLKATLAEAKTYQVEDYSDSSYATLDEAIRNAEEKLDSVENARDAKNLEDALKAAIKGLKPTLNSAKTDLRSFIADTSEKYAEEEYTEESYAALQSAIKNAEEQMGNATTVSRVISLKNSIQVAIDALEKRTAPPVATVYTVRFDSAGGSSVASQKVTSGKKAAAPKKVTRRKYLFKGWYMGKTKYDFTKAVTANLTLTAKWTKVTVSKTKIKTLRNTRAKQCTVKVKKLSKAAGYQYVYSTDKKFKKAVKVKNSKKYSVTLKNLKKGKTCYVKVRAYRYDSTGKKVYGKYCVKKTLKIRK